MKKLLNLAIMVAIPLVLSGCSLTSNDSGNGIAVKKTGSIWKSVDGGKTWEAKTDGGGKINFSSVEVLTIAVDPMDGNNILVGTVKNGILRSKDGGGSWETTNFISEKVYGLGIDPADSKTIYASGIWQKRGKLFKTSDNFETWQEIYTSPANGPLVVNLKIDKNNSKVVYFSTSDNQVIKSEDGGNTWKNIYSANSPIVKIEIDNYNGDLVYLLSKDGDLFRSKDGSGNFEEISKNFSSVFRSNKGISDLISDPSNSNWIYLAGNLGIIRSKDGGENWEKIWTLNNPEKYPVKSLAINPKNSNEMVCGVAQTAYKSADGGNTWQTFQFDYSKTVSAIKYSESSPENIFLGFRK